MNIVIRSFYVLVLFSCLGCKEKLSGEVVNHELCTDSCIVIRNNAGQTSCCISSPELMKRKNIALASLKKKLLEKRELGNGFAYRFPGNNITIDELFSLIKAERECCPFFTFNLSISGDKKEAWLDLTGPGESKSFIIDELGF